MSVTVTLHVFSGRPDPAWELSDTQADEFASRLRSMNTTTLVKPEGMTGGLGYRGFSVESVREKKLDPHVYIHRNVIDLDRFALNLVDQDSSLERWLLETAGEGVEDDVRRYVEQELTSEKSRKNDMDISGDFSILRVPPYDPGKWNNDPNIRVRNNCYNYANDIITNTFAQPGRGSGTMYGALTCGEVGAAARRDGLQRVSDASSTPAQGHFCALVIWPNRDFHWYRLDSNAYWSHKPGRTNARNTDNSGRRISDPRHCDRGPYTDFCDFYHTIPAQVRIR